MQDWENESEIRGGLQKVAQYIQKCDHCGKPYAEFTCNACRVPRYCQRECQREDWRNGHKKVCVPSSSSMEGKLERVTIGPKKEELSDAISRKDLAK